jgi:hypothetical protein
MVVRHAVNKNSSAHSYDCETVLKEKKGLRKGAGGAKKARKELKDYLS